MFFIFWQYLEKVATKSYAEKTKKLQNKTLANIMIISVLGKHPQTAKKVDLTICVWCMKTACGTRNQ